MFMDNLTLKTTFTVITYLTMFILISPEEEKQKRLLAEMDSSSFHAVGFSYDSKATPTEDPVLLMSHPQLPEHPPTSSVDIGGEEDTFTPPPGLVIPKELRVVSKEEK